MNIYILISAMILYVSFAFAKQAPSFDGEDLEGNKWKLKDNAGKSFILVDFWSTTCEPCKDEHPHLNSIKKKFKDKITIVAISLDPASRKSKVKSYMISNAFDFKVLIDSNKEISRLFQVNDIPQIFLIDLKGEIVYSHRGYSPGDEIEMKKKIEEIIEKKEKTEEKTGTRKACIPIKTTDLNGKEFCLEDIYKKGAVIIDFWSTTCSPCKDEHLVLSDFLGKYAKNGLQIVSISTDPASKKNKIIPYLVSNKYDFIPIHDEDGSIKRQYQVTSIPVVFIINKNGEIVYQHTGYEPGDEDELEKWLKIALGIS